MLLLDDDKKPAAPVTDVVIDEPLPAYSRSPTSAAESSSPASPSTSRSLSFALAKGYPAHQKASNFVYVSRNGPIRGTYAVDPALSIPATFLSPLAPGETRDNLRLHSNIGTIRSEVWLAPARAEGNAAAASANTDDVAKLAVHANCGSVFVALRAMSATGPPHPFALSVHSNFGNVFVLLPRTFRGALTMRTELGRVGVSRALRAAFSVHSTRDGAQRCFVGDLHPEGVGDNGAAEWDNEIALSTNMGGVRVAYEDESLAEATTKGGGRWYSSLLNR